MANPIVQVIATVAGAPAPSLLQRTGAMVTQGGTKKSAGTLSLLTMASDLTALQTSTSYAISALSWSSGTATATVAATPWNVGDTITVVVSGMTPAGWNGIFQGTVVSATDVTFVLISNPGTATVFGTMSLGAVSELQQMVTTFFAQSGSGSQAVYVLELGEGMPAVGPPALATYITNNPLTVYSWLVPREWSNISAFLNILPNYNATSSFTYFYATTTVGQRADYVGNKCVFAGIESPGVVAAGVEFSMAMPFFRSLYQAPSSTNRVLPMEYGFTVGVTGYPPAGNGVIFAELAAANVSYFSTAAQGGLTNTALYGGNMSDGNPWNFWYSTDWIQINLTLDLANEVFIGSNNQPPLDYDQDGIDRLQTRGAQTFSTGIGYALGQGQLTLYQLAAADFANLFNTGELDGQCAFNAEPFVTYSAENPSDYSIGRYAGFAGVWTPLRGFDTIIFNLTSTNIIAQ